MNVNDGICVFKNINNIMLNKQIHNIQFESDKLRLSYLLSNLDDDDFSNKFNNIESIDSFQII